MSAHRMSDATASCGDELLAWKCVRCGRWIREYGPSDRSVCTPRPLPDVEETE